MIIGDYPWIIGAATVILLGAGVVAQSWGLIIVSALAALAAVSVIVGISYEFTGTADRFRSNEES